MSGRRHPEAGFSFIELVAVLAVFALVATMALQALQMMLRGQERLQARDGANAALTLAIARLRLDLEDAVALPFHDPSGAERPALQLLPGNIGFALSLAGQPVFDGEPGGGLARVEWRLDDGTLTRRLWPTLIPAANSAAGPAVPVLEGVQDLAIASFAAGRWTPGWAAPEDPATLPLGLRVQIATEDWGRIEVVEAF